MRRMNIPNGYKCFIMGGVARGGMSEAWSCGFEPPAAVKCAFLKAS
jgi:hypothetical protein